MAFDAFIETAWNDHGDRPQEVADRLAASLQLVHEPGQIPPYARLVTHVFGEHLGQWQTGIDVLEALRGLPAFDGGAAAAGAISRSIATLRLAGGDRGALDALPAEDRVSVLATTAAAFAGRTQFRQAIAAYTEALRLASAGLPAGSPALRALAVGGNNLAAALEEKADRDASETEGMIAAAEGGLHYWKLAGTWLEEERALYRLARSRLQAGEPEAAIQSALRCVEVCTRHDAPAFEHFFASAVLALAQRAAGDENAFAGSRERALQWFGQVPEVERQWCTSELKQLGE
jgi:tetratricopeptide (TPR) repeat protein